MNLIHSIIALTFLAEGSAVNPLYSNSSAVTNYSVTTVNSSGITDLATKPISSGIANYSSSANSTIRIQEWVGKGCTGYMVDRNLTSFFGDTNIYTRREPYSSFKISRPLRGREQLDFSREKFTFGNYNTSMFGIGTDLCGNFLQSYWPRTSPDGCVDLGTFRCVRIWLN